MLDGLLGSKLRAKLLGWLFTHPDERYFVRQLTKLVGEDSTNISRELSRLEKMGIVTRAAEGRQKYYQANAACPVFAELRALVTKTAGVAGVLRAALEPLGDRVVVAFVFGSFARGDQQRGSDVDVMIVGDAAFAEVVSALSEAQTTLGREINPSVYGADEFRAKLKADHHFLKSVMGEKKVLLIGDDDDLARLAQEQLAD